jgi:hypothetical protein
MAPEQARGRPLDHRADLFSLGSVLYALCAGRPPFWAPTTLAVLHSVCEDTPEPLQDLAPTLPDWLVEIIEALLAKAPADRIQTADEVARLLSQHLCYLRSPALVRKPRRLKRRPRPQPRRPKRLLVFLLILLLLALAGLGGVAGWFAFRSGASPEAPGTGQPAAEEGPPVLLSNGRATRLGARWSIQVDYRLRSGQLPAGARCTWVVQSPGRVIHQQAVALEASGTLWATQFGTGAFLPMGPLETYLVSEGPGLSKRISNSVSLWP